MRHWICFTAAVCCLLAACATKKENLKTTPSVASQQQAFSKEIGISPNYALPANQPYMLNGTWYYPLRAFDFYDAFGIASWYGPDFDGKPTSSGETYNMEGFTAAHRILPIPSLVRVTSLGTGKSIVVKVNDRGPFVGNREIDLSYGAAKALGIAERGLALVHIELLPPTSSFAKSAQGFYLQTGSFKEAANARNMTKELEDVGFNNAKVVSDATHYRVVLGPYENPNQAHAVQDQLRQTLGINPVFSSGE
jgi:rare lipoprotein A